MSTDDFQNLVSAVVQRLGDTRLVGWTHSRRHHRHGYTIVELPPGLLLPCSCGQTKIQPSGYGDITGFEAVMDDRRPERRDGLCVLVYEANGQVRHQSCGQAVLQIDLSSYESARPMQW